MSQAIEVFATLRPDTSRFGDEARRSIVPQMRSVGLAAAAGLAVVVGGAAVVGKALFNVGEESRQAFNTIRVGTGATGRALEALKDDFRGVTGTVPAEMADVSTAIADLNTRLGLTGPELQDRSRQFLELSRITGTDLSGNIQSITRLFGDWSIETGQQEETMNRLFRASQTTGAGIDWLAERVVQYGAPMREFGFSFDEAIALMGSFEQAGVNTETVMAGMRQALGRLARSGEDPRKAMMDLLESIDEVGLTAENKVAVLELFGQRAGTDMARAIEEGRFSIDELVAIIADGEDTIISAGEATQGFSEKWMMLKERIKGALEPAGQAVIDFAELLVDKHAPEIEAALGRIGAAFRDSRGEAKDSEPIMDGWAANIRANSGQASEDMEAFAEATSGATVRVLDAIARIIEVHGEQSAMWRDTVNTIKGHIDDHTARIERLAVDSARVVLTLKVTWDSFWQKIGEVTDRFGGSMDTMKRYATDWRTALISDATKAMAGMLESVQEEGTKLTTWFANLPGKVASAMGSLASTLFDKGKELIGGFVRGIRDAIPGIGDAVGDAARAARPPASSAGAHIGPGGGSVGKRVGQVLARFPSARISSAYRSPEHNRRVGGAPNSFHMDRNNPAHDIVAPSAATLDAIAAQLRGMGPWREFLWRVKGHAPGDNMHIHVAHDGGMVSANWPTLPGLKSHERPAILEIGEKITPKGGDGGQAPITLVLNVDGRRFATATAPAMRDELRHLEVTYS